MSQNIRATGCSVVHGISWKVAASGTAIMSDSWIRLKPSIEEPSNPIPSAKAPSSSCEVIVKDLRKPRTSVNHSRTKRMPRSSTVRRTYSASALSMAMTVASGCAGAVTRSLTLRGGGMRTVGIVGWVVIVTAFLVWQGFALVYTPTWPTMSEIVPDGDAAAPRAVDRVRGVAMDRMAPVRARLELLPAS